MSKTQKRNTKKAPTAKTPRPRWTEDAPASEPPARAHAGALEGTPQAPETSDEPEPNT